eukprot:TRINITY_DN47902_c0_g1_i1.p1 TRINITY_DN47902_c0_g1~~TRINITY_DN47902_c0_g1_i1.p1  ORF type:complete len:388 (+),score=59.00 TRINITY_DN47902_c0_g1_i1:88-1164(+)
MRRALLRRAGLVFLFAPACQRAIATNPACWTYGFTAEWCCDGYGTASFDASRCWSAGRDAEVGPKGCCETGGYLLEPVQSLQRNGSTTVAFSTTVLPPCRLTGNYFLPANYKINEEPQDYVDSEFAGQAPVYGLMLAVAKALDIEHIVEVGGGSGVWAQLNLEQGLSVTLLDREGPNLRNATARLRAAAPEATGAPRWQVLAWDVDAEAAPDLPRTTSPSTLVIAADVVEHLQKPERLLAFVAQLLASESARVALLSTPDRHANYDRRFHRGPPHNRAHVREWTAEEFGMWLGHVDLPASCLFEVEGTVVAVVGLQRHRAYRLARSVWSSAGAVDMGLAWRRLSLQQSAHCKGGEAWT